MSRSQRYCSAVLCRALAHSLHVITASASGTSELRFIKVCAAPDCRTPGPTSESSWCVCICCITFDHSFLFFFYLLFWSPTAGALPLKLPAHLLYWPNLVVKVFETSQLHFCLSLKEFDLYTQRCQSAVRTDVTVFFWRISLRNYR